MNNNNNNYYNNKPPHYPPRQHPHHHHQPPQHHRRPHGPHPPHPLGPLPKPPKSNRTTLSSCIVATIFLIFIIIIIILFIVYFSLFKPKHPTTSVTAIQLPSFSISTNGSTVSFTFSLYAAIKNPNRGYFSHYDSSIQLLYAGNQVGFMFIPSGNISAQKTEYIAATFAVQSFPISQTGNGVNINAPPPMVARNVPIADGVERIQPTMELELRLEIVGRVRVLWVFSHHLENVDDCHVAVSITDGSVLGFHC